MDKSTEWARRMGKCPDEYWYQVNGKSPYENLEEQTRKRRYNAQITINEDELQKAIEKALDEILKGM